MSDILIKGFDMPKCCCDCLLFDSSGFCALDPAKEFENYNHKRPNDCPLVEISTPHGDLIDRDKFIDTQNQVIKGGCSNGVKIIAETVRDVLLKMPVIIEAEANK